MGGVCSFILLLLNIFLSENKHVFSLSESKLRAKVLSEIGKVKKFNEDATKIYESK